MEGRLNLDGRGTRPLQFKYWLYAKMLKETENEETRVFCPIFVKFCQSRNGGISIQGARAPWATSLATPMIFR